MNEITFEVHEEIWSEEDYEIGETDTKGLISKSVLHHAISDLSFKTWNTGDVSTEWADVQVLRCHNTDHVWAVRVSNFEDEDGSHHIRTIYFPESLRFYTRERIARLIRHRSRSW